MMSGYSHRPGAVVIPSRLAEELIAGNRNVLTAWVSVPRDLVWDGEAALSSRNAGNVKPSDAFEAFRRMPEIRVITCKPGDPEAKGLLERFNGSRWFSHSTYGALAGNTAPAGPPIRDTSPAIGRP